MYILCLKMKHIKLDNYGGDVKRDRGDAIK